MQKDSKIFEDGSPLIEQKVESKYFCVFFDKEVG